MAAAAYYGCEAKPASEYSRYTGSQQKQASLATLLSIAHPPTTAPRAQHAHAKQAKALLLAC